MSEQHAVETPGARATAREWTGLAVLALPCLLYSMDLTVLYLAVPQITQALQPGSAQLLWIVDVYGFMVAGFLVTMGTLGDRIGRRRLLMIGAAAFGLASALVAFAPTAELLILARAAQGISAATLAPSTLALIRNMFHDDRERTLAIGIWVAAFSAGAVLGPVIGGAILSLFWWGAVFLINVPLMVLLLVLGPLLLPESRDPGAGRIDMASALLSLSAVLLGMYGLKRLAESGIAAAPVLAIATGVALGVLFVKRQRRLADPMIDVSLFGSRRFCTALAVNVLGLFTVLGSFLFISQHLQLVVGLGPLEAGLWTAPSGLAFVLGSLAAPLLVRRWPAAQVVAAGLVVAAAGYALLLRVSPSDTSPVAMFIAMMVLCAGLSPIGTITTDIVLSEAPPERAGAASAISETSFEFGGAAGIAVLGSVLVTVYRLRMAGAEGPPEAVARARSTLAAASDAAQALGGPAGENLLAAARTAFVDALHVSACVATVTSLIAALVAWRYLDRRAET